MASTSGTGGAGQEMIRGIDIDKLAKGFADLEPNVIKSAIQNSTTTAREIRWYQRTAGFIDTPDTTAITDSHIFPVPEGTLPYVAEQSWTRNTSYVKKFMLDSPLISIEDIKDSDVDIFGGNFQGIVRGVQRKVGIRIYQIMTNALINDDPLTGTVVVQNTAAVADGWNDATTGNPIKDLLVGQRKFRQFGYQPIGSFVGMNSLEHEYLLDYLINVKGSSIPGFSSEQLKHGVVMEILNSNIIVDEIFTTDWVIQWVSVAATWKTFIPITAVQIEEPLIGVKIRVAEEGECILTDPNAVHVIFDTAI